MSVDLAKLADEYISRLEVIDPDVKPEEHDVNVAICKMHLGYSEAVAEAVFERKIASLGGEMMSDYNQNKRDVANSIRNVGGWLARRAQKHSLQKVSNRLDAGSTVVPDTENDSAA